MLTWMQEKREVIYNTESFSKGQKVQNTDEEKEF